MGDPAITVRDLTRKFDDFTAVNKVSFQVGKEELFGLLGPNGAGKTTIINMLCTLLDINSGQARVANHDVRRERDKVRHSIGVVFQEPALDGKLTGRENLEFHCMMYGMERGEREAKIAEVLDLVELTPKADELVENYSGGMKRRLEIARGLTHRPDVLFLDEPTLGLDAQTRRHIWDYIKKLNSEKGVTIILTTHYMEEADYLCERVAIIDHGKIVSMDTPQNLKNTLGGDIIDVGSRDCLPDLKKLVKKISWVKTVKDYDGGLRITVEMGEERIPQLVQKAYENDICINSVSLHKPSLEDVFLHFTGKRLRDEDSKPEKIRPPRGHR